MDVHDQIQETVGAIRKRSGAAAAEVGVILGSGLGDFADRLSDPVSVPYGELPHFPRSSVPGHAGRLVVGGLGGARIVAMQGRVHFYEGFTPEQVVFPARVLCALGIRALVVTNAAGGINRAFASGDLMVITDHLNLSGWNPLVGPNHERLGPRFPDMSTAYDPKLRALLFDSGRKAGVALKEGVYACVQGPSYETPAEIRMLATLGADAVGMSTVPEVIAAAHMGVPVAGLSCITNLAAGLAHKPLSHGEVAETAERVKDVVAALLTEFLPRSARL